MKSDIQDMTKCIIHFGTHKTGSTSIQKTLYRQSNESFYYVNMGISNASKPISVAFMSHPETFRMNKIKDNDVVSSKIAQEKFLRTLDEQLNIASGRTAIISGEAISMLQEKEIAAMRLFIEKYYSNILTIGYVRTPKSFIESAFQQRSKASLARFNISALYPCYKFRFEKFLNVFGPEAVHMIPFQTDKLVSGCVVRDFCSRFGIDIDPASVTRDNDGLALSAVKLLYTYGKFGEPHGNRLMAMKQSNEMASFLRELKGPKLRFHSELIAPVLEKNAEDIAWIEEQLGDSLSEDLEKYDDCSIRSETDLLTIEDETTRWLAEQLGDEYKKKWNESMSSGEIAEWMHALRLKLMPDRLNLSRKNNNSVEYGGAISVAPNIKFNEKSIEGRKISEFSKVEKINFLQQEDEIKILSSKSDVSGIPLNDLNVSSYVLSLKNAFLIPKDFIKSSEYEGSSWPKKIKSRPGMNLLLDSDFKITPDSFFRYKSLPDKFSCMPTGVWSVNIPKNFHRISEPCIYGEMLFGHFGHALTEVPARLWAFQLDELKKFKIAFFPSDNLKKVDFREWPEWLHDFLRSLDIDIESQILLISEPTVFDNLLVPSKISPIGLNNGAEYDQVMARSSDFLVKLAKSTNSTSSKIFLSRSRLKTGRRSLPQVVAQSLERIFIRHGFDIIHPQELPLPEQVRLIRNATYIAGVTGSQMHLGAFCTGLDQKFLKITPSFFQRNIDKIIHKFKNTEYSEIVIDQELSDAYSASASPWSIPDADLIRIDKFLDNWVD